MPPWLWFWLVSYLVGLPNLIGGFWVPALRDALSGSAAPGESLMASLRLARLAHLAELAPLLAVFLGIASLFVPQYRTWRIGRRYDLGPPPETPAMAEIRAFLSQHAPGLSVRTNPRRGDQLTFVYPLGYRVAGMALFGGMLRLWRRDRPAAEAVLLHEIAHYRQGDALILGAGSPFATLLRLWLPLQLVAVVLPLLGVWAYDAAQFVVADSAAIRTATSLTHKLGQLLTLCLPGLLLILAGLLLWAASAVILPLAGIWCAELSADRFVMDAQGSSEGLARAVAMLAGRTSWRRWLLSQMSHPPVGLRAWFIRHYPRRVGLLGLLWLFPLAYVGRLLLLLGRATTVLVGMPGVNVASVLAANVQVYFRTVAPIWLGAVALLLVWPVLAVGWERWSCGAWGTLSWRGYREHVVAAAGVAGASLLGLLW